MIVNYDRREQFSSAYGKEAKKGEDAYATRCQAIIPERLATVILHGKEMVA